MEKSKRPRGASQTGFRADISKGAGPVFEVRRALKLNQTEMANKLGVSFSGVAKWERLGTGPRIGAIKRELERLAAEAGVDLSEGE